MVSSEIQDSSTATSAPPAGGRIPLHDTPGRTGRWESEAGPSRRPAGHRSPDLTRSPSPLVSPHLDSIDPAETGRAAREAARKGKAPIVDSEDEEDLPRSTPVGGSEPVLEVEDTIMEDVRPSWRWVCQGDAEDPIPIDSDTDDGGDDGGLTPEEELEDEDESDSAETPPFRHSVASEKRAWSW